MTRCALTENQQLAESFQAFSEHLEHRVVLIGPVIGPTKLVTRVIRQKLLFNGSVPEGSVRSLATRRSRASAIHHFCEERMIDRVYVAGPYTQGDVAVNVRNAYEAANRLADLGFAPFVPHATHFWHMIFPRPYEFWLELDNQFLSCCAAVLRLPGASTGADKEVQLARTLGIPVFTDIDDLDKHFRNRVEDKKER